MQHYHPSRKFWEIGNMGDQAVSLSSPTLAQGLIMFIFYPLLSGTSIFPMIALSIIRTGRYRKTVVEKLHTKFENVSKYSLQGLLTMNVTTSTHLQCHLAV